jgi:hypothetical protein
MYAARVDAHDELSPAVTISSHVVRKLAGNVCVAQHAESSGHGPPEPRFTPLHDLEAVRSPRRLAH